MRKVKTISGKVVGWVDGCSIVKNIVQNYNEGFLELYSPNLDLLYRRDELKRYVVVEVNGEYIFHQDDYFGDIYILNGNTLQDYTILEGRFQVENRGRYENHLMIFKEDDDEKYYYLDQETLTIRPTGFAIINKFNYTYSGCGIRYYNSCIYCYNLNTKELVWKINTHDMQYDRGGRHMAYSTPDNDVPDRCYFWDGLLITVFESHTAGIELSSGRIVWEDNLGSCSLRDFLDNGVLYVNRFGLFYQLDAATGKLLHERSIYVNDEELKYDFTTSMVYNDKFIYFSMTRRRTLITLRKDTFEVVSEEPLPYSGEGVLYENSTTYLVGNKLFLTFRNDPPQPLYETLVCEV